MLPSIIITLDIKSEFAVFLILTPTLSSLPNPYCISAKIELFLSTF